MTSIDHPRRPEDRKVLGDVVKAFAKVSRQRSYGLLPVEIQPVNYANADWLPEHPQPVSDCLCCPQGDGTRESGTPPFRCLAQPAKSLQL